MMQLESLENMIRAWTAYPSLRMKFGQIGSCLTLQIQPMKQGLIKVHGIHWQAHPFVKSGPHKTGLSKRLLHSFLSPPMLRPDDVSFVKSTQALSCQETFRSIEQATCAQCACYMLRGDLEAHSSSIL